MNTTTCINYLNYVSSECDKYLKEEQVNDDQLVNLIIEFQRFQEQTLVSDLPDELKKQLAEIKLDYSIKGVERSQYFVIIAFLTFGSWAIFLNMRRQAKRKQAVNNLKFDTSRLASWMQLNC